MGALHRLVAWTQRTVDRAIDRRVAQDAETAEVLRTFCAALDERDRVALKALDHASAAWSRLTLIMRRLDQGAPLTAEEIAHVRACADDARDTLAGYRRIVHGQSRRLRQLRKRS